MPDKRPPRFRIANFLGAGEICHYATSTFSGQTATALHTHDFVEVFWVTAGAGQEIGLSATSRLTAGDLVFVSAPTAHGIQPAAGGSLTICNFALPIAEWKALRKRYGDALRDRFGRSAQQRLRVPHLLSDLNDATAELRRGARTRLAMDRFLLRLDALLAADEAQPAGPSWLTSAVRQLASASGEELSRGTAWFAKRCAHSAEHVARCCRQFLGRTPTELVDEARLHRAARLLAETDRPVLDVCYDSGFNNVGHFHARFQAHYGQTPRRYRVRAQGTLRSS